MTLLELKTPDLEVLEAELSAKIAEAPAFFLHSPVVLGFDGLSEQQQTEINITELQALCQRLNLTPSAVRSSNSALKLRCQALRLAVLPKSKDKTADVQAAEEPLIEASSSQPVPEGSSAKNSEQAAPQTQPSAPGNATKIVHSPVRSGQQIYAPGGDLIVLSGVSAGAEVLADGNIHIYGPLRGRALAGIQGNTQARIFCASQEAELVSIAGSFMVDENLRTRLWKQAVQIFWVDGDLDIQPLV